MKKSRRNEYQIKDMKHGRVWNHLTQSFSATGSTYGDLDVVKILANIIGDKFPGRAIAVVVKGGR
jgi:hypothetical protein